jgi:alcohol dehydrogenase (nicotinoprotein)
MRTRAATVIAPPGPWVIDELDLLGPFSGEVLVRWDYAGLCFSDEHARLGDFGNRVPNVGGHEGAGVVVEVGQGVTRLSAGDHVVASFIPVCGRCRWCSTGKSVRCEAQKATANGTLADGTYRFNGPAGEYASFAGVATFANFAVVQDGSCVKVDPSIPLELAALASCGVLTGWGAAVRAGGTQPGETVAVVGAGGIGVSAMMGALNAGAANVIVVDPMEQKRAFALSVGATQAFATAAEARIAATDLNPTAEGADVVVVAAGTLSAAVVSDAFSIAGLGGRIVVASMSGKDDELRIPGMALVGGEKRLIGTMYGSTNPHSDIPLVLDLATRGRLPLSRMISGRYSLDQITQGYIDLAAGRNIRGVLEHDSVRISA